MTDEEQAFKCACIMSGARVLGFRIREVATGGLHYFYWHSFNNETVVGAELKDRKQALITACDKLADYFNVPPNDPVFSKYKF